MKKYSFIYLFFLCLIAISCENTAFEEEIPATSAITRSSYEDLGYYGSNFIDPIYSDDEVFAFISLNPVGAEYSFNLATVVDKPDTKSVVSVLGGSIIYNGRDVGNQIDGVSGMMRFTVKFTSTMAKVTLTLKGAKPDSKSNSARLSIDQRTYNGESLPLPVGDPNYSDFVLGRLP